MVQFKVGDVVYLQASVQMLFCGSSKLYDVLDINISKPGTYSLLVGSPCSGYSLSGIQLEFDWVDSRNNTDVHNCYDTIKLAMIASGSTSTDGSLTIQYTITNTDLNYFNSNAIFDLRACIKNKTLQETTDLGKVRNEISSHSNDFITIIQNLCINKPDCPNKCFGNDLYSQVCNPATGNCIQGTLIQSGSPICNATDRIDYDFSLLPTAFLDLISANILDISDALGPYLPTSSNIQYLGSDYVNGKFRIFVTYTPSQLMNNIAGLDLDIPYLESLQLIQTLGAYALLLASVLLFILAGILAIRFGWQVAVVSAVIGLVLAVFSITHLPTGQTTPYNQGEPSPDQKIKIVKDYVNNYLKPACNNLYPTCAASPPTCDVNTMRAYVACMGGNAIAQCRQAAVVVGDPSTTCDSTATQVQNIDTCLANHTCNVQTAKTSLNTVQSNTETYVDSGINKTTCSPGFVYDSNTQKCIEQCAIPGPLGTCLLTQAAAKEIAILGIVVVGGYFALKALSKPKTTGLTITTAPTPAKGTSI